MTSDTPSPRGSCRIESPLVYVKDQLGHHSIKVTVDVYGHLVPGANKAAVDRLDEQAQALEAAMGQGEAASARADGLGIERNPTHPPATSSPSNARAGSRIAP